jgi:hypothetical protein
MRGEGLKFGKKEAAMRGFKTDFNWAVRTSTRYRDLVMRLHV